MSDRMVRELLARVLDSGCTPEEACLEAPELLPEVRTQLRRIRSIDLQLEALFPATADASTDDEAPAPNDKLPQVPGHEVLSLLGHGGMGVVYKARHLRLNRAVAVKMLLGGAHTDAVGLERLLREAEAVAALRHPNIVHVHEIGDQDGLPYFTMELVEGGSLRDRLDGGPLDVREAASLVATLAEAMQAAHAQGIVHRDLKPENVLLTTDGVPKIADFGLARRLEAESSLTMTDARLGTPSYMAPEQALQGARESRPAADLYSLGAILYAALTGRPPFRGTPAETLRQLVEDEPVAPSRRRPRVPRDLETICLKCLSKDPARRYATAAALAADLQRFLRGEPVLARPVGFLERARKWARRRPAQATLAATVFLAVLALAAAGLSLHIKRSAINRAARADLADVDRAAAAADWPAARTALERARARLTPDGSAELLAEVEQGVRELEFVETLDAIRMQRAAVASGRIDRARNDPEAASAFEAAFRKLGFEDVPGHPQEAAAQARGSRIRAPLVSALDTWATCSASDPARRDGLLVAARLADPDPTGWRDRVRDPARWNDRSALDELMSTAPVSGESVMLLLALSEHVMHSGADAVPFLARIQQEYPSDFWANLELGMRVGDPVAALRYFQTAVAVRPDAAVARLDLGNALGKANQFDEAVVQFRKTIAIDPTVVLAHTLLGRGLSRQGHDVEALEELVIARRLDPESVETRNDLGHSLLELGRLDECIAEYREALRRDPGSYDARFGLAYALLAAGRLQEAFDEEGRMIASRPDPYILGLRGSTLVAMGRIDDAIAAKLESIRLAPLPSVRRSLVQALLARGRFEEARTVAGQLLAGTPAGDPAWPSAKALVDHCELIHAFEASLPAILDGTRTPQDGAECLAFADLFRGRQEHAAATRYFADAFERGTATTAEKDDDWRTFDAACCAALAASAAANAKDAAGQQQRSQWCALALAWFREELVALDALLEAGAPGCRLAILMHLLSWRTDPALAGLRDVALLDQLPEDERSAWQAAWLDADSLTKRTMAP